jgi:cytochrome c oxidase cbb3-type subunit III
MSIMAMSRPRRTAAIIVGVLIALAGCAGYFAHVRSLQARLLMADPDDIVKDAQLMSFALPRGRSAFVDHCSSCHGATLAGDAIKGVPNLSDRDWLYGAGRVSEIERIVLYGIRSGYAKGWNLASMPAFATPNPYKRYRIEPLTPRDLDDITAFVMAFQQPTVDASSVERGAKIYHKDGQCFDCHGDDARGDPAIGAPDLTDKIWLYGDGSRASIHHSIARGLAGTCPAWIGRIPFATIRAIAVYINSVSKVAT